MGGLRETTHPQRAFKPLDVDAVADLSRIGLNTRGLLCPGARYLKAISWTYTNALARTH